MATDRIEQSRGSCAEVLLVFLRLGCTSFGGPVAHLGYFRKEIVERRKWCSEGTFGEIIALTQSLPGPASSQTGFVLGIVRAGWLGGLAAWTGFTLPSALLMLAFAYGHSFLSGSAGSRVLHALQIVAVAVVAQAVLSMRRSLAPDRIRIALAIMATGLTLLTVPQFSTLVSIAVGAALGLLLLRSSEERNSTPAAPLFSKAAGLIAGGLFFVLLALTASIAHFFPHSGIAVFSAFYGSGALVFGGGHVVLPLLENAVVARGWVTPQAFLVGYGAAQALPGPLFAFAAYLGAAVRPTPSPFLYGLLGLIGIFTPGLLVVTAALPFWSVLRGNFYIGAALKGVNASVVGILLAAFIRPLWATTIHSALDFGMALVAFLLLTVWRLPAWLVVVGAAAVSTILKFQ